MLPTTREEYARIVRGCTRNETSITNECATITWYHYDAVVAKAYYYADATPAIYKISEVFHE